MSYNFTRPNRPYFGPTRQVNNRPNFPWTTPHQRPIYPNKNAQFNRYQQNSDNSDQYWCETCDRGFKTLQQLEGHKQQHQKCKIDGCQFIAHPKVITKHIQMQHSSGLYKRISKLDNPEEIKKWIEERKKKYPTKENIEKKSAEIKEKIQRGEKMGLRQDRFQRNNSQGGAMKRKNTYNNGNIDNQQTKRHARQNNFEKSNKIKSKKVMHSKTVNIPPPINETRKLRPFTGIQNIDMEVDSNEEIEQIECNFEIEDDNTIIINEHEESKTASEPIVCGALISLMRSYVSSDEEDNEVTSCNQNNNTNNIIGNKSKETKFHIENETSVITEENKSDDDSGPEETKVVKSVEGDVLSSEPTVTNSEAKKQTTVKKYSNPQHKKRTFTRPKPRVPSTLLHKLLQREVQHERNVILQCVRYIVKNKYFDK